jgi:hypothetical protein
MSFLAECVLRQISRPDGSADIPVTVSANDFSCYACFMDTMRSGKRFVVFRVARVHFVEPATQRGSWLTRPSLAFAIPSHKHQSS